MTSCTASKPLGGSERHCHVNRSSTLTRAISHFCHTCASNMRPCIVLLICLCSVNAYAQRADSLPVACTYNRCALRIQDGNWFGRRLVKGVQGDQAAWLSNFGGGVDFLQASPDPIGAFARDHADKSAISGAFLIASGVGIAILVAQENSHKFFEERSTVSKNGEKAVGVATGALMIAAWRFNVLANRALDNAVRSYNATLPRD